MTVRKAAKNNFNKNICVQKLSVPGKVVRDAGLVAGLVYALIEKYEPPKYKHSSFYHWGATQLNCHFQTIRLAVERLIECEYLEKTMSQPYVRFKKLK